MKVLKRVFSVSTSGSISPRKDAVVSFESPVIGKQRRRQSLPGQLACDASETSSAPLSPKRKSGRQSLSPKRNSGRQSLSPKPNSRRKQVSQRHQQKIQQFLKQGSFARRTWEETQVSSPSPSTVATASQSSSSLSSSTSDDDLSPSHHSAPTLFLEDEEEPQQEEECRSPSTSTESKLVRWDSFVERDQTKRELSRQFRNAAPEWKQRQLAHRVHHCNARKAELEEFQRSFLDHVPAVDLDAMGEDEAEEEEESKEIKVAPAAGAWFERNDRDISAEFLTMDIDLFGNKKKEKDIRSPGGRSVASF